MHDHITKNLRLRMAGRPAWNPVLGSRLQRFANKADVAHHNILNTFARTDLEKMSSERAFKGVVAWELVSGVVFCIMLPGVAFLATKAALDQHKMTMTFYGSVLVVVTICCSLNFGKALTLQRQRRHFDLHMNEIRFSRIVESSQNKVRPKKNTRRQSF